jgi:cysteine desulfuration protein SufE
MTTQALSDIIGTFQSAGPDLRLELLLDYARRLPALPGRLEPICASGVARVPECQTPVCLILESDDGQARIYAQVPEESPTVRGFVSILIEAYDGAPMAQVAAAPQDLLEQLGLQAVLSSTRAAGLHAVVWRLRQAAARRVASESSKAQVANPETSNIRSQISP